MKHLFIWLIRFYRRFISPLKPPCCRFTPTCSAYALEAFQKRGFFVGFALMAWRILRCNPFCMPGYDPVPEKGFDHYPVRIPKYANGEEPEDGNASEKKKGSFFRKTRKTERSENRKPKESKPNGASPVSLSVTETDNRASSDARNEEKNIE